MKKRILKNPGASIRARLYNHARASGDDFQRVLTRYAIERLLFRLSRTEGAEHYVLKGAMLFATWPDHALRPTGDLDLLGHGDPDPAVVAALFRSICRIQVVEDGIVFDPTTLTVEPVREADKYQGVRLGIKGELSTAIVHVQVDLGFGDYVYPPPSRGTFPILLPDMPAPMILMYPPETVVAEKFETLIRFGQANGRIRDFYDLWVTSRTFPFELGRLVESISGTLRRRETAFPMEMPVGLTEAYALNSQTTGLWTGFLRRTPPALKPPLFPELQEELRRFFGPVISALALPEAAKGDWDPGGGGWRRSTTNL